MIFPTLCVKRLYLGYYATNYAKRELKFPKSLLFCDIQTDIVFNFIANWDLPAQFSMSKGLTIELSLLEC